MRETPVRLLASILIGVTLLTACGTKGPLYLPQDEKAKSGTTNGDNSARR